jgi:hypothetical protein
MTCGWQAVTPAVDAWALQPRALALEDGGFFETEDCERMTLDE